MKRNKIILWGGFWDSFDEPLRLEHLNSHASVTAFFLNKYLSKHFKVIQINSFDNIFKALEHKDALILLSTFQAGFSRLIDNNKTGILNDLKITFKGRLCSIVDTVYNRKYVEDMLFTVLPNRGIKNFIKKMKSGSKVIRMGWSADDESCYPVDVPDDEFNVFVDHGHYDGKDYTSLYYNALREIVRGFPDRKINVFNQNNEGIVKWDFKNEYKCQLYRREAKVSWMDIIEHYRRSHVFCLTHRESAGLSIIEAAMCGAKIYIPCDKTPFISEDLIKGGLYHEIVPCDLNIIEAAIRRDIINGVDRTKNHERVKQTNSWEIATDVIYKTIKKLFLK